MEFFFKGGDFGFCFEELGLLNVGGCLFVIMEECFLLLYCCNMFLFVIFMFDCL